MDRFLLIFLIIITIIELFAILYYRGRYKIVKDYCDRCKATVNEMLGFIDSELNKVNDLLKQEIKEKGENNNESN